MPDTAIGAAANSYDAVPYPATAQTESHPDRLAALATLLGLSPAPPEHCRVLELGCSDGGNLIPLAYSLPDSEFLGVDYSAREVANGQPAIAELGLKNIALRHLNILDAGPELGTFDYILACGVYSWVPPAVQEHMLALCRQLLKPQGVAYINYNTYPGWFTREPIRQMLLYQTPEANGASFGEKQRAIVARQLLDFFAEATEATLGTYSSPASNRHAYVALVRHEQALVNAHPDSYLMHEHLEENNTPIYFREFVERAGQHGLQYLAEAEYALAQIDHLPPDIRQQVQQMSTDLIRQEQLMDFISNRSFRQTLLVHHEQPVHRDFGSDQLRGFYIASPIMPESEQPDLHSTAREKFRNARGTKLTATHPVAKTALMILSEIWPQAIAFDELLECARRRLEPAAPPIYSPERLAHEAQGVGEMLLHGFRADMVELHVCAPRFQTQISARPAASLVARHQARGRRHVINLRHEPITIDDEITYRLLPYVDGQHDRPALLAQLRTMIQQGTLIAQAENGRPYAECDNLDKLLAIAVDQALHRLANAALLIA